VVYTALKLAAEVHFDAAARYFFAQEADAEVAL
jgi:hypothetical protein